MPTTVTEGPQTTTDTEATIKRGLGVLGDAIKKGDAINLARCMEKFAKMGCLNRTTDTIKECPIDLLIKAGVKLPVWSEALQRNIVLGGNVSWEVVKKLLASGELAAALKMLGDSLEVFDGSSVKVENEQPSLI